MKILVVEDETLMKEDIVRNLNQIGYNNVRTASNGIDALTMLEMFPFDLILSDIKMPLMDGIELLRQTKESYSYTIFIILSGYDLFEYARQALTLGAFGYLLKPIDVSELTDTMKKAVHYIDNQKRSRQNTEELVRKISNVSKTIRNRFLCDLISPGERTAEQITAQYPETGVMFPYESYAILLFDISFMQTKKDTQKFETATAAIVDNLINNQKCNSYCYQIDNYIVCLCNFSDFYSFHKLTDLIVTEIKETYPLWDLKVGLGECVTKIDFLERAFITAKKSFLQSADLNTSNIHVYQETNDNIAHQLSIDFRIEKELLHLFEQEAQDNCIQYIISLYNQFIDFSKFDYDNFKKLNLNIILSIYKIFSQLTLIPQNYFGDEFGLYKQINKLNSIDAVEKWYQTILASGFDALNTLNNSENTKVINSAKKYIQENLAMGLTMEGTASFVNLSPTYFSRFFKQETGSSFIDYVTDLRIEAARKMLTDSFNKISDIAYKVGFNDLRYFYKVFKKHTGFTPTEYKKRIYNH